MSININGAKLQTTINNTKYPQYSHTLAHNIPSQTIFNLNTMTFLGETSTQIISNSRLTFIFPNGSIIHNQTSAYFQCPTPIPMRVLENCSFDPLNSRIHNTLRLTNDQFMDKIYYRQPSIVASKQSFFHSLQLENDDDVCTMLMCNE